eukprot:366512-Chlamydomonas_euryale.AAC.16
MRGASPGWLSMCCRYACGPCRDDDDFYPRQVGQPKHIVLARHWHWLSGLGLQRRPAFRVLPHVDVEVLRTAIAALVAATTDPRQLLLHKIRTAKMIAHWQERTYLHA